MLRHVHDQFVCCSVRGPAQKEMTAFGCLLPSAQSPQWILRDVVTVHRPDETKQAEGQLGSAGTGSLPALQPAGVQPSSGEAANSPAAAESGAASLQQNSGPGAATEAFTAAQAASAAAKKSKKDGGGGAKQQKKKKKKDAEDGGR